jgi:hypothetical protein
MLESMLGRVLVVETSGSSYGSMRDRDKVKDVTGLSTTALGTRHQAMSPAFKVRTG